MEFWGSEFFDDGNFGKCSLRLEQEEIINSIKIPMKLMDLIVDKKYIAEIDRADQIDDLTSSISIIGLQHPGEIVYSEYGIRLQNGNHRYIALKRLKYEYYPVVMKNIGKTKMSSYSLSMLKFFEWYLNADN